MAASVNIVHQRKKFRKQKSLVSMSCTWNVSKFLTSDQNLAPYSQKTEFQVFVTQWCGEKIKNFRQRLQNSEKNNLELHSSRQFFWCFRQLLRRNNMPGFDLRSKILAHFRCNSLTLNFFVFETFLSDALYVHWQPFWFSWNPIFFTLGAPNMGPIWGRIPKKVSKCT